MSEITPSQTVGPFFAYGLTPHNRCDWKPSDIYDWKNTVDANLVTPDASGTRIRIEGRITDGDGAPINDAMIEIWQADSPRPLRLAGRQARHDRTPCSRASAVRPPTRTGCSASTPSSPAWCRGRTTSRRRRISWSASIRAACCGRSIRGSTSPTRPATPPIPILALVPEDRRGTLIAHKQAGGGQAVYRFDIRMQGENETVFFDV